MTATNTHKRQRQSAGWHLQHSYLDTYGMMPSDLAVRLDVSPQVVEQLVQWRISDYGGDGH